jgi:uncharacterized Zn finger protein
VKQNCYEFDCEIFSESPRTLKNLQDEQEQKYNHETNQFISDCMSKYKQLEKFKFGSQNEEYSNLTVNDIEQDLYMYNEIVNQYKEGDQFICARELLPFQYEHYLNKVII